MTRIKLCGITRTEDLDAAVAAGVDAVGLVFAAASPRCLELRQAAALLSRLPPFVTSVGLFQNQEPELVSRLCRQLSLQLLQFHGEEDEAYCAGFGLPYIKAIAMGDPQQAGDENSFASAQGLLLDAHRQGGLGGQGVTFDWSESKRFDHRRVILAGGLNADNVAQAISRCAPWAVDVSSGVEISPGIKDHAEIQRFCRVVRQHERYTS